MQTARPSPPHQEPPTRAQSVPNPPSGPPPHQPAFARYRTKYGAASIGRGSAKIGLGQFEEAIADSEQTLQLQPEAPDVQSSRGIAQSVPGRFRGATVDFDQTLRLEPDGA